MPIALCLKTTTQRAGLPLDMSPHFSQELYQCLWGSNLLFRAHYQRSGRLANEGTPLAAYI